MKTLTVWQAFCLMFLFQLGSTVVFGFAGGAKQDAWIVVGVSTLLGCGLVFLYAKLFEWYPEKNWASLMTLLFGRYLGHAVAFVYIAGFIYVAGRVLRDFGELIHTFFLPKTPIQFIMLLFLLIIAYGSFAGLERMGQFAELNIPVVFVFLLVQLLLLLSSNVIRPSLLLPVAANWKNIGTTIFPLGVTVPFGETIAFTMFSALTVRPETLRKAALRSSVLVGIVLILLDVSAIVVLGPDLFSRSLYPLLSTFQLINIADFAENMDPLVVSNFLIGGFFKIFVFFYAACAGITTQWRLKSHRSVIAPLFILIWLLATYMTTNISSHVFIGLKWVPWVMWVPLFIIIPLIVFVIGGIRNRFER